MKKTIFVLGLSILLSSAGLFAGELDGTQWRGRESGLKGSLLFWQKDILKFENGTFTSEDCVPYGFKSSAYESKKMADKVTWNSLQTNDKGETMEWRGTQVGNKMKGTYTWKKPDGKTQVRYWQAKMVGNNQ